MLKFDILMLTTDSREKSHFCFQQTYLDAQVLALLFKLSVLALDTNSLCASSFIDLHYKLKLTGDISSPRCHLLFYFTVGHLPLKNTK